MFTYAKNVVLAGFVVVIGLCWASGVSGETNPPAVTEQGESTVVTAPRTSDDATGKTTAFLATITGDNVNIRSGQAEIYPPIAQLNKGREVIVKAVLFNRWAQIYPTAECYSFISKQFVKMGEPVVIAAGEVGEPVEAAAAEEGEKVSVAAEPASAQEEAQEEAEGDVVIAMGEPEGEVEAAAKEDEPVRRKVVMGVVTGDNVRVRAGAAIAPAYADEIQTKLNRGALVQIIGERDDYYMIVCPPNCYFYVALDFIKRQGPASEELIAQFQAKIGQGVPARKAKPIMEVAPAVTAAQRQREEYKTAAAMLEAELAKPLAERDLAPIREKLEKLLAQTESPSVKVKAQNLQRQLDRSQFVVDAYNKSLQQDRDLQATLKKINEKQQLLIAVSSPLEKTDQDIVLTGRLTPSAVFDATGQGQRFLVVDDDERIVYYATSGSELLDLGKWVNKKVSMVGRAKYDSFANVRVLEVKALVELPGSPGQ